MFWKPPNWPKTSPNFVHPPKPIFTRTIKFKTTQSGNTASHIFECWAASSLATDTGENQSAVPCNNDVIRSDWVRPIGLRHLEFHARTLYLWMIYCHCVNIMQSCNKKNATILKYNLITSPFGIWLCNPDNMLLIVLIVLDKLDKGKKLFIPFFSTGTWHLGQGWVVSAIVSCEACSQRARRAASSSTI